MRKGGSKGVDWSWVMVAFEPKGRKGYIESISCRRANNPCKDKNPRQFEANKYKNNDTKRLEK
jgi:hypothetical protein